MRTVAYGSRPLPLPDGLAASFLLPPHPPPEADLEEVLVRALGAPIQSQPLRALAPAGSRVTVIISDATRDEPRGLLFRSVRRELAHLADEQVTIAIANGTHTPGPPEALGLGREVLQRHRVVNHDATDLASLVELGQTSRGTRVRVHRALVDTDLVVATGRIKPHYFAGYGAGAKALFPGLGAREDIRQNHKLKQHPSARLGRIAGNACREDVEDAVRLIQARTFLLNVVMASDRPVGAVAGDLIAAHRRGCELARPYCEVAGEPADIVITSDALPTTINLYQASKLLAPAGWLLRSGGVAILAAECPRGTGPLDVVNEAIFRIGIRHYFAGADEPTIYLVSSLPESVVAQTYCRYAGSVEDALSKARAQLGEGARVLVLPRAGDLIPVVS
ncbi:MAG TPA: lactate racemase domain-containing protein [Polyangia bacterium]|nr:lactate racemase domain-containing protein [Polyangia bacterium]